MKHWDKDRRFGWITPLGENSRNAEFVQHTVVRAFGKQPQTLERGPVIVYERAVDNRGRPFVSKIIAIGDEPGNDDAPGSRAWNRALDAA